MSESSQLWKIIDHLMDAVIVVDRQRRIHFANVTFCNLADLPERAIRSKADAEKYIQFSDDIWQALQSDKAGFGRYREVDFETKSSSGCAQVYIERIIDGDLSPDELFIFVIRDTTLEARLHNKYKNQIESNEKLIKDLERNLAQTAFLRGLAQDLPLHADASSLLAAICKRMKGELGFQVASFFQVADDGQFIPFTKDNRLGSKMRQILAALEDRMSNLASQGNVLRLRIEPYGAFWVIRINVKMQQELILVTSEDSAITGVELKPLFTALRAQVCTLLDNRRLYTASITDELTGLLNRRFFDSQLASEVLTAQEESSPLSMILFDVDFFKNVNDVHGHAAGDQVLKSLGALLRKRIRETDICARVGGEEFAIILPGTSAQDALIVAEQIREMVVKMAVPLADQKPLYVTISCGVAGCPTGFSRPEDLYQAADSALYQAKESGRNRSCVYDEAAKQKAASGN